MDNSNTFFVSFDADDAGRRIGQAILNDDPDSLRDASQKIDHGNEIVAQWAQKYNGVQYSSGGDQGVWLVPVEALQELESLRKDYEFATGMTISIGVADTLSGSGRSLLVAKVKGKNQIVFYGPEIEKEIQQITENVRSGHGSSEEQKLAESYIEPTQHSEASDDDEGVGHDQVLPTGADAAQNEPTLCEPPKDDNNRGYDSGYKNSDVEERRDSYQAQDLTPPIIRKPNLTPKPRVEESFSTDIPESDRVMNNDLPDPKDMPAKDLKPAPKDYHGQAEGAPPAPEGLAQPMQGKPSDLKYNGNDEKGIQEPDMPRENATTDEAEQTEESDMLGDDKHCPSCTCGAHGDSAEDTLDQHVDNAQDFADAIGNEQEEDSAEDTLDAHVSNASEMNDDMDENGVSRPADYDQRNEDMGLSEEDADDSNLNDVFKDGLDAHADSIQREKVVNMVGEALEAFKGQKAILDKAKAQAPELYDACIAMLRSMIELCSLAGIDEGQAEQEVNEIEGQSKAPEEASGEEGEGFIPESEDNGAESEEAPESEEGESCPTCGTPHEKEAAPGGAAPFPKK